MLGKGHGGLYNASTKEERSERLRGEGGQIKGSLRDSLKPLVKFEQNEKPNY